MLSNRHTHMFVSALMKVFVNAKPQQQQVLSEAAQSNDADEGDGLFPILDAITVIVHVYLADDACSDESDDELKVELA